MGLLFDLVRQGVTAREAAEAYGLEVNRYGRAHCPWHDDNRPSLSFKGQWCRCFACNSGGSAIDLTAQLYGISPLEAAQKLNHDFHIGADEAPGPRPTGPSIGEIRRLDRMAFNILWGHLCDMERTSYNFLAKCTPADADRPVFRAFLQDFALAQDRLNNHQGLEALKEWANPSAHSINP